MKQVNSHLQVLRMMFMGSGIVCLQLYFNHSLTKHMYTAHYHLVANAEVWSPTLRSGIVPAFGIDVDDENDGGKRLPPFVLKATSTYTKLNEVLSSLAL